MTNQFDGYMKRCMSLGTYEQKNADKRTGLTDGKIFEWLTAILPELAMHPT